jgi:tungstate transport system ATP-binding protein
MTFIETVNISQVLDGRDILKNINLKVDKAEVFTLVGPTGSGKTTLLRILDLIQPPHSGKLLFDGTDMTAKGPHQLEARRRMSYVQQKPLVFTLNVFDNIACGLKWRHIKSSVIKKKTDEALELVGMTDFKNRHAKTLSGGETQRVAIARALVTDPELLFLDEPTANMDPISTAKIEEALSHIISECKTTIIMTTHNMSQGQRMASRLGVLISGELMQTGSVNDIFNQPRNREVAEFVGVDNIISGVVDQKDNELARISVNGNQICGITNLAAGEKVFVLIRPEMVTFSLSIQVVSARNVFKCRVEKINTIGSTVRIEVNCGFPLMGVITTEAAKEMDISIGKEIYASFKATAVHVVKQPH